MNRNLVVKTTGSLFGAGLLALWGCVYTAGTEVGPPVESTALSSIATLLESDARVLARQLEVESRDGIVYLSGVVDTERSRSEAGRLARRERGVRGVVNDLTVSERTSAASMGDMAIGAKLTAVLRSCPQIRHGDIEISSSLGVVTLIGRVGSSATRVEAERLARGTPGVREVFNHLLVGRIDG